jgi:hypothetical protein
MKFLLLLLSGLAVTVAQAELVIYRFSESSQSIGGGAQLRLRATGYLVLDYTEFTGKIITAATIRGQKVMTIVDLLDITEYTVAGLTKTYTALQRRTVIADPEEETLGFTFSPNTSLRLEFGQFINYPRTFSEYFQSARLEGANYVLYAGRRSYGFRSADTFQANTEGLTVDQAIAVYRDVFARKGYVQSEP